MLGINFSCVDRIQQAKRDAKSKQASVDEDEAEIALRDFLHKDEKQVEKNYPKSNSGEANKMTYHFVPDWALDAGWRSERVCCFYVI